MVTCRRTGFAGQKPCEILYSSEYCDGLEASLCRSCSCFCSIPGLMKGFMLSHCEHTSLAISLYLHTVGSKSYLTHIHLAEKLFDFSINMLKMVILPAGIKMKNLILPSLPSLLFWCFRKPRRGGENLSLFLFYLILESPLWFKIKNVPAPLILNTIRRTCCCDFNTYKKRKVHLHLNAENISLGHWWISLQGRIHFSKTAALVW